MLCGGYLVLGKHSWADSPALRHGVSGHEKCVPYGLGQFNLFIFRDFILLLLSGCQERHVTAHAGTHHMLKFLQKLVEM